METKVIVTVPTVYQYTSASRLMRVEKTFNGGYTGQVEFNTIKEARKWLIEKGNEMLSDGYFNDKKELRRAIYRRNGKIVSLSYDAATAYIKPINE